MMIAALITFFPVMVNTFIGLRSVNPTTLDFFRLLNASEAQVLLKLRVASALPYVFAAFRIAVPLSVIGAVVGEWFTGDRGPGQRHHRGAPQHRHANPILSHRRPGVHRPGPDRHHGAYRAASPLLARLAAVGACHVVELYVNSGLHLGQGEYNRVEFGA